MASGQRLALQKCGMYPFRTNQDAVFFADRFFKTINMFVFTLFSVDFGIFKSTSMLIAYLRTLLAAVAFVHCIKEFRMHCVLLGHGYGLFCHAWLHCLSATANMLLPFKASWFSECPRTPPLHVQRVDKNILKKRCLFCGILVYFWAYGLATQVVAHRAVHPHVRRWVPYSINFYINKMY